MDKITAIEEHIKECEHRIEVIRIFLENNEESDKNQCKANIERLETVKSELEKMIPTQPRYEADGYYNGALVYDMAYCPKCDHDFEYNINDWGSKFCPDCGQALDWSVGEEGGEE